MKKVIKTIFMPLLISAVTGIFCSSCSDNDQPENPTSFAQKYSGTYSGTITLNVADQYSYNADITCVITEDERETITVTIPEYSLAGTMMGDLILGSVSISDIPYDENKGCFFREYGGTGITQTMNGKSYPLNSPSSIHVTKDEYGNLTIENPFTLGKMPLPLTATFKGHK